jgi:hypothetical protein
MPDNFVFEFQDSEVSSAELKDQQFVVRFSAAHVRQSKNDKGNDAEGFLQSVQLIISDAVIVQNDSGCVGRVSHGVLRVAGTTITLVPIPYDADAKVELELVFSNGSMCKVSGQRVTLKSTGEAHFVEWLKC